MAEEDDMIFVNSKKSFHNQFYPNIVKLLNKFCDIKNKYGSIYNELIKKQELNFIEMKKQEINVSLKEIIDSIRCFKIKFLKQNK